MADIARLIAQRVLLLEAIAPAATDLFKAHGFTNVEHHGKALDGGALHRAIADAAMVGIRSRTQLTGDVIAASASLIAAGCFSAGTNQVDLAAANLAGIPIFNAPYANTRSVAELTLGEIIMLFRRVWPKSVSAHQGGWDKNATGAREVRGKLLGIVGYGNIGSQLALLAEAVGMRVIYFDVSEKLRHGNAEPTVSLDALLDRADVVSLHVPETAATRSMIGAPEIARMKRGTYLINNSRGTVVEIDALAAALTSGHLAGAAVDVFPVEPSANGERFLSPLAGLANVILTPHIGGSTEEAQDNIGIEVARKLIDFAETGTTAGAVNFPHVQVGPLRRGARFLHVHANTPGQLGRLNDVFARHRVNISAQVLQTDAAVGYVVLDADGVGDDASAVLRDIAALPGTIRARLITAPDPSGAPRQR